MFPVISSLLVFPAPQGAGLFFATSPPVFIALQAAHRACQHETFPSCIVAADIAAILTGAARPLLVNAMGEPGRQNSAATSAMAQRRISLSSSAMGMPRASLPAKVSLPALPA